MGKVAQVLITGYWPDRVPRRIGVPQKPLGEQYLGAARSAGDAAAFHTAEGPISHARLLERVERKAAGLAAMADVRATVALYGSTGPDLLELFFAVQVAGCRAALLDPSSADSVQAGLAALSADLMVCTETAIPFELDGLQAVHSDALDAAGEGTRGQRRTRWRDVAAMLPHGGGWVRHGHVSTTAMVKDLTTYIPLLADADFICQGSLHGWETFAPAMTALLSGRAVIFDPEASSGWSGKQAYTVLHRKQADEIAAAGRAPDWARSARLLFVVMSDFDVRWRRRLEKTLRRPVLPLWGTQRTGPAICAHPSWAPVDVHGLPLTNAMLIPLDPANGAPSDVPWEMLSRAELGIEAPSVQIKDECSEGAVFDWNGNQVARTGRIVAVDRLGMVRFLDHE